MKFTVTLNTTLLDPSLKLIEYKAKIDRDILAVGVEKSSNSLHLSVLFSLIDLREDFNCSFFNEI